MIISHKYQFIFIKTFKVAGTSLEVALSKFLGPHDVITPISPRDEKTRKDLGYRNAQNFRCRPLELSPLAALKFGFEAAEYLLNRQTFWVKKGNLLVPPHYKFWNHIPAEEIRRRVPCEVWDQYYKFSIERNPWDYVVSLYEWWRDSGLKASDFRAFLERGGADLFRNRDLYAIKGRIAVDQVLLYETLSADLTSLSGRLGLPEDLGELVGGIRAKQGGRGDYHHYYDVANRKIVQEKFNDTIRDFGYAF